MKAGMRSGVGNVTWKVGTWAKHKGKLNMCHSGFHASVRAIDAMQYVNCEVLALVEARGKHLKQSDKQCWLEMRVVRAYRWEKPDSVAMAIYAAELVIGEYEKQYPDDKRPRQAIEAAKKWLDDPTEENRQASASASAYASAAASASASAYAYAYAYASAYAAASASAYAAASASAYAAASAAASADAGDAAAYAASADAGDAAILDKVEKWIIERIKTLKEVS